MTKLGGKYNIDAITILEVKDILKEMKSVYNNILKSNIDLTRNDIVKFCKFINSTPVKYLNIFIDYDFDYDRIVGIVPPNMFSKVITNHDMLQKLKQVRNNLSRSKTNEERYVKLLVDIKFYTRLVSPAEKENLDTYAIVHKKGKIVKFAYQNKGCDLIVCHFGNHQFPLAEGEYEWVK